MQQRFVLVGGASGIGLAVARLLSAQGHGVVVVDRAHNMELYALPDCEYHQGDIRDREFLRRVALDANREPFSGMVITAALGPQASSVRAILETNLLGTTWVLQEFTPYLQPWTSVVLIGSTAAYRASWSPKWDDLLAQALTNLRESEVWHRVEGLSSVEAYGIAKEGLRRIAEVFFVRFAPKKIRLNCLVLSITRTAMSEALWRKDREKLEAYLGEIPFGEYNDPRLVANTIAFLLSDDSRMIHGNFIFMDGGWNAVRIYEDFAD